MNDLTKEQEQLANKYDILFGSTIVPECYYESKIIRLTKKEKLKQYFYNALDIIKGYLIHLMLLIGILLQVAGLAYIAGFFFKFGAHF